MSLIETERFATSVYQKIEFSWKCILCVNANSNKNTNNTDDIEREREGRAEIFALWISWKGMKIARLKWDLKWFCSKWNRRFSDSIIQLDAHIWDCIDEKWVRCILRSNKCCTDRSKMALGAQFYWSTHEIY